MKLALTKREKILLVICGVMVPILNFIPIQTINKYELLWLIFFALPSAIFIITDPERKSYDQ